MAKKEEAVKNAAKKNNLNIFRVLFWAILLIAVAIRLFRFGALPCGVNQDEAMGAVDAWALSLYGTDRFGVSLPVHFSAWQVSQMSVLLSYLMVPFIKVFGFTTWAIRLPMLLASIGGIVLVYLVGREIFGGNCGLIAMALTAVNPWHFMQSRWSIDCNLFPHVFLLAFYLLLKGLKKRRYLYLSMFFFGLTFYCYGIAVYSVTAFLAVYALWGLRTKAFRVREILSAIAVFGVVILPEMLVMAINLLHWDTMHFGPITMSRFPESVRGNDILFLNFSFAQLGKNIWATIRTCLLQLPDYWFNSIPYFGPLYHISIPFMVVGTALLTKDLFDSGKQEKTNGIELSVASGQRKMEEAYYFEKRLALWGFLVTGVWVGIITYEVNVNRINIIFYPLLLATAYAVDRLIQKARFWLPIIAAGFGIFGGLFVGTYFTVYPARASQYYNGDFLQAVSVLDEQESPLYITGNMGWQFNLSMAEILTQYALKIDAQYFQGKSNVTNGKVCLPYQERYHYINARNYDWENGEKEAAYLLHEKDLEAVAVPYQIDREIGEFRMITLE